MFGGGAKPPFGQTAPTTGIFGQTATTAAVSPFGQSTFGKPATAGFGQSGFGQQNTSLFGSAQPSGTGLFGASTSTGFGAAPATTQPTFGGGFAQPQQNSTLFGGAQPAPVQQTTLFGQTGASAFGAAKPNFTFGQSAQPTTSLFGQSASTNTATGFGSFGQNATTNSVFGSTGTTAFGQQTTTAGTSTGTSLVKYQPSIGTDTLMKNGQANNVNTKQHCITAMKEYENKSLEELRMEDYMANRKGPQAGATGGFFGQTQQASTTGGLFGQAQQQPQTTGLFGQQPDQNKTLFGQTGGFGQTSNTAFGATSQVGSNFLSKPFSAPATSTSGFGSFGASQTDNTAKPFGQNTFGQTTAFGQATTQPAAPAFGQQSTGFGGFGAANQTPSVFGQPSTDNKPSFGLPSSSASTGFSVFGATANTTAPASGGLFGAKPATGFGATTAFGGTPAASTAFGGGFGTTNTTGSLFNNTMNKPATSGFSTFGTNTSTAPLGGGLSFNTGTPSLFGNNANKPGGLFGMTTQQPASGGLFGTSSLPSFGATNNTLGGFGANTMGVQSTLGAMQQQPSIPIHQQILAKVTSPYGENPIFKDLKPLKGDETDAFRATNPLAQKAILESSGNQFKVSSKPANSIKIKPVGNAITKKSLFEGLEEYDSTVEESFSLKPNAKRLVLKPRAKQATVASSTPNSSLNAFVKSSPSVHKDKDSVFDNSRNESFTNEVPTSLSTGTPKEGDTSRRESWLHPNALEKVRQQNLLSDSIANNTLSELVTARSREDSNTANTQSEEYGEMAKRESFSKTIDGPNESFLLSNRSYVDERNEEPSVMPSEPHPTGIVLRRVGYYTIPSLDELKSYLSEDGSCIVPNFTIGREGYGNVFYDKQMDVAGLNLDEIVHFRHKEVILYPDDEKKPPVGTALNREAQITLDQVWPHDKVKHEPIRDPKRLGEIDFESKLRRVCDKQDIRFIEYRPETGSWVFRVKHFSKYGLNDSDEEDDVPTDPKKMKMQEKKIDNYKNANMVNKGKNNAEAMPPSENINSDKDSMIVDNRRMFHSDDTSSERMNLTSPTAALAKGAGTDSHKLQLMKASFFVEDDTESKSVASENLDGRESPDQMVPYKLYSSRSQELYSSSQSLWKDGYLLSGSSSQLDLSSAKSPVMHMSTIDEMHDEFEITQVQETAHINKHIPLILKPKIAGAKVFDVNVPFSRGLSSRTSGRCISDLAVYNCRRFKIGFGSQNSIVFPTSLNAMLHGVKDMDLNDVQRVFQGRSTTDYSAVVLQQLKISSTMHNEFFERSIIHHLETQLRHSLQIEVDGSDCPYISSTNGSRLIEQHLEEAIKNSNLGPLEDYAVSVWSLCVSLWGEQEELENQDTSSHYSIMCRRNLLSDWLENTLTEKESLAKDASNMYLDHIMNLLMCHKVPEACELAFKNDDANLALLLSQLSGGPSVRQLMEDQLAAWHKDEADKFISVERLKLCMLIAGIPLMKSHHGPINNLEGHPWLKVLALQLWYLCSPTCSITDAVIAYENSFKSDELYALPPSPAYEKKTQSEEKSRILDLRYHILQLYSKRSHPMESLLNPATHTPDSMDYRLSWLLLGTLEALGYHHCSELSETQLHIGFASQLENHGLWHWAVFVLLHIKNKNRRELCVQDLLYRYVTVTKDVSVLKKEKFVVNCLGIPEKWIDWAKAVKAGALGKYRLQAKYLLKAKQWALAHEVIFQYIAPDAIINGNLSYLNSLLIQFERPSSMRNIKVPNWSNQGQIFLDYIEINDKFKTLKSLHEGDVEARWESLKPQLADLCSRINLLPCPTSKHRLCQSEIAQSLACLVRGVLIACPVLNPCLIIKIALEKLPLPQEFAQKELRTLLDTLVTDMCKGDDSNETK